MPLGREYAPKLVLVSAGFDAHRADPLASCACTAEGFGAAVRADVLTRTGRLRGCVLTAVEP